MVSTTRERSRSGPGHAHNDCQFDEVTLTLDGELFVDRGRLLLLDDPQVRELAEAWGPADVLLDPNPRMIIPTRYTLRRDRLDPSDRGLTRARGRCRLPNRHPLTADRAIAARNKPKLRLEPVNAESAHKRKSQRRQWRTDVR
jgi:hypothetical protein